MNSRNWQLGVVTLLTLLSLLIALYVSTIQTAQAIEDPDELPSPMVGLTEGQTARFNLANLDGPKREPCDGEVQFFDSDGKVLLQEPWVLERGKATFVDLAFAGLNRTERRVEIRAIGDPSIKTCTKGMLASLEIVDDASSRTMVVIVIK